MYVFPICRVGALGLKKYIKKTIIFVLINKTLIISLENNFFGKTFNYTVPGP